MSELTRRDAKGYAYRTASIHMRTLLKSGALAKEVARDEFHDPEDLRRIEEAMLEIIGSLKNRANRMCPLGSRGRAQWERGQIWGPK